MKPSGVFFNVYNEEFIEELVKIQDKAKSDKAIFYCELYVIKNDSLPLIGRDVLKKN